MSDPFMERYVRRMSKKELRQEVIRLSDELDLALQQMSTHAEKIAYWRERAEARGFLAT